ALVVSMSSMSALAELNMEPGMWEAITTVDGNQMPPEQKCYLQKDVDALDRFQRGTGQIARNASSAAGYHPLGTTLSYTRACADNGKKTISAVSMNYDGNRITGEIIGIDGTRAQVLNTRISDCSESSFGN